MISTQQMVVGDNKKLKMPKKIVRREEKKREDVEKMLINNKHLISLESDEILNTKKSKKKKEIISYIANRDSLFIPHPERSIRPVDISSNLIENAKTLACADIGIQSDVINYVNPEKPFIPQKIGKDVGVQIEDGDLFNFDRDIQPLLEVLCGKILEQSELELTQEAEIKNLRDTKNSYLKKLKSYKEDLKKQEDQEILKKKEFDNLQKSKVVDKMTRIECQRKLTSRVFSKAFLTNFYSNVQNDLIKRNVFLDYTTITIKDNIKKNSVRNVEDVINNNSCVNKSLNVLVLSLEQNKIHDHNKKLNDHRQLIITRKQQAEERKKIEEEQIRREEEERQERRRKRDIKKLRDAIKTQIFNVGVSVSKDAYTNEEVSGIDNYDQETPFIGIYGGLIGAFMISFSIIKKHFFNGDNNYTQETITEILSNYLTDCEYFPLCFDSEIEENLKTELNVENIDFSNLKSNDELTPDHWIKIGDFLSNINYNYDFMLKHIDEKIIISNESNTNFYPLIIKSLCKMVGAGIHANKIKFSFKSVLNSKKEFSERIKKYQALCVYEKSLSSANIFDEVEFIKDNKKKPLKIPDIYSKFPDLRLSKFFQKTSDLNILIYDKIAEFNIRNMIVESSIRAIQNEIETKPIFMKFNELYDKFVDLSEIGNKIHLFTFNQSEFEFNTI